MQEFEYLIYVSSISQSFIYSHVILYFLHELLLDIVTSIIYIRIIFKHFIILCHTITAITYIIMDKTKQILFYLFQFYSNDFYS